MFTEDITSIVIDPGSLYFKSGYSGEDTPRVLCSSKFGNPSCNNNNNNEMEIEN